MNEINYEIEKAEKALDFYKDNLKELEKYILKENNSRIIECAQIAQDGLSCLIINKEKELNSLENKSKEK